jgi:hypothetical protein
MDEGPIYLLLDCFSAHHTEAVKEVAVKFGIILHFMLAGLTDEFHPLDQAVFTVLKAQAEHVFRTRFRLNRQEGRTK